MTLTNWKSNKTDQKMIFKYIYKDIILLITIASVIVLTYIFSRRPLLRNKCGGGISIEISNNTIKNSIDMSNRQDDFIILASNVSTFGDLNSHSKFKTRLARRRVFPSDEDWRVALTEITYKQSWYNVRNDTQIKFVSRLGGIIKFDQEVVNKCVIEAGFYPNISYLISYINSKLKILGTKYKQAPSLYVNPESQKVSIYPGSTIDPNSPDDKFIPFFGEEVENILGLVDEDGLTLKEQILSYHSPSDPDSQLMTEKALRIYTYFTNRKFKGYYPADINAGFSNLYIYSNIVQQSDVGDAFSEILTTVPNKLSKEGFGGSIHHEPKNLVYRPLQTRNFDTIEVVITDDRGVRVPFELGNVVIKLKFLKFKND